MNLARRNLHSSTIRRPSYAQRIIKLFGTSIVAYWPLWDASGTVVNDIVGNYDGTYTGAILLANAISPGRKLCPKITGTQRIDGPVGLLSDFNKTEGTLSIWVKCDTGYTTDAAQHVILNIYTDGSNFIQATVNGGNGNIQIWHKGSNVQNYFTTPMATTTFFHIAVTWSDTSGLVNIYYNGTQRLATAAQTKGVWVGNPTYFRIGNTTTNAAPVKGWLSDALLLNRPATNAEIRRMVDFAPQPMTFISYFGDSITTGWATIFSRTFRNGAVGSADHSVGGQSVVTHLTTQVSTAINDRAEIAIIQMGTNDVLPTISSLQSKCEEAIIALRASNPTVTIYWINVFPRWTDVGGGTEVDKSQQRTAIAAGCAAQGVTCWDTYTTPWITAADTTEGLHPNTAGSLKICNEILSRIS